MHLKPIITDFLLEQRMRGNSPKTIEYYSGALQKFSDFVGAEFEMDTLTHTTLRQYTVHLQDSALATVSIQSYVRALRAFLTWSYHEEYLSVDFSAKYRLPKAKRAVIDILTQDECSRLMKSFNPKYYLQLRDFCICGLMLDSGLRMHEVTTLRLSALHLEDGYLIVDGKGNKQRTVPIGANMRRLLSRYLRRRPPLSDADFVFVTSTGIHIQDATIKQLFRKLKTRCDIPRLHAHLLRHTFASCYLENGGNVFSLQQILGHTSLEMTRRYVHLTCPENVKNFRLCSPLDKLAI
ncbi:MAG: tyrosine-type recombinase/integrase [Ruthenibacterium sp.]